MLFRSRLHCALGDGFRRTLGGDRLRRTGGSDRCRIEAARLRALHLLDGMTDQVIRGAKWGSDLAAIHSSCGSGTQLLITESGNPAQDSLRAFEAVARHLSFAAAADEMNLTPSAISHRIRRLEEHFRVRLFRRLNPGVALTEVPFATPLTRAVPVVLSNVRLTVSALACETPMQATNRVVAKRRVRIVRIVVLDQVAMVGGGAGRTSTTPTVGISVTGYRSRAHGTNGRS